MVEKEKISFFKQIAYMLGLVWQACPAKLIVQSTVGLLQALQSFIFEILFIKFIIQILETNGKLTDIIIFSITAIFLKLLVILLNSYYTIKLKPLFDLQVSQFLHTILFNKCLMLDLEHYENKEFYETYNKAAAKIEPTAEIVVNSSIQLFSNIISIIFVLSYVVTIDPLIMVLMVIPIITTIALKIGNSIRYQLTMENIESKRKLDYVNRIVYLKEYALELRLSGIFECLKQYYNEASLQIKNNYKFYGKKLAFLRIVSDFMLTNFTLLFAYIYGVWRFIFGKNLMLSDFSVLVNAIKNLNWKVSTIIRNIYILQENGLFVTDIKAFLAAKPAITKNESGLLVETRDELLVAFQQVSFSYQGSTERALSDINFTIHKNEKVAIVGRNGSGKSTLVKLLLRLYDVTDGAIYLNGYDIREINLKHYRERFMPVFQDFRLFAASVGTNITLGSDNQDDIENALHYAGLYDQIQTLEKGVATQVSKEFAKDGVVLSGGQRQKLALTRAFAARSEIVILDEPTSSLDPEAEYLIYKNIYRQLKDKTVIFISHRLSSTIMADKILMIDGGRIGETGSHAELMQQKGLYYKLFRIQANSYQTVKRGEKQGENQSDYY